MCIWPKKAAIDERALGVHLYSFEESESEALFVLWQPVLSGVQYNGLAQDEQKCISSIQVGFLLSSV